LKWLVETQICVAVERAWQCVL